MVIIMWLVKTLGLRGITQWGLRLMLWGAVLLLLVAAVITLSLSAEARLVALISVALVLGCAMFLAWERRRKGEVYGGPRTIDGKIVPDMLAAAALDVPLHSPDSDYVLRGLPDYGKALLKLNSADFEYVPEIPETIPEMPEKPAVDRRWRGRVQPWVIAASAAVLLVAAGVRVYQAPRAASAAPASRAPVVNAYEQAPVQAPAAIPDAAQTPTPAVDINPMLLRNANSSPNSAKALQPVDDPAGTSRDAATGLLWSKTDNGPEPIQSWQAANDYCESLTVGGLMVWRLPSQGELDNLGGEDKNDGTLRGGIQTSSRTEFLWTGTPNKGVSIGIPLPPEAVNDRFWHALCVHD